ncbi:MAG: hypothetical protein ABIJ56_06110 [Pseudomonadota bacterium]
MKKKTAIIMAAAVMATLSIGARKCGEGINNWFSENPAPDVTGDWNVTYDDEISVEIDIGGEVYSDVIGAEGGTITFTHDGNEVSLDLDCSKDWIQCPSEVYADQVTLEQRRFQEKPHQVHMTITEIGCATELREPVEADGECDSDDPKRPCDIMICDEPAEETKTTIGDISDPGNTTDDHPAFDIRLLLGGGIAVPTANCILVAGSEATADIAYTGSYDVNATEAEMTATKLENGEIRTTYAGACFWFEEVEYSEELQAALLGASITFKTGYTAVPD